MPSGSAVADSFLANVDPRVVDAITRRAVVQHANAGEVFLSETGSPWVGIVLSGMARVFLRTPSGRQVTLRSATRGGSIGIAALLAPASISAQAITDCDLLRLDANTLVKLAHAHPDLAMAIARELSVRLIETYGEIVMRAHGSVHQRLARQLLHLSSVRGPQLRLTVTMSHSEIADAVGSAREVVTRHLHTFQADGVLRLERGRITILDPLRLHEAG
jgi:CRP/FNR family transcriptional regulator, cyclic AMP receptor protein